MTGIPPEGDVPILFDCILDNGKLIDIVIEK